ncbi:MAG: hypothetical protein QXW35_05880 [Candidatus Aenigmatarchaeota archaeon]
MCGLILINRLGLDVEVKTLSNPLLLETIAYLKGLQAKFNFENSDNDLPSEKLKEINLIEASYDLTTRTAEIKYDVFTEDGSYAPLHIRIPLGEDNYIE